MFYVLCFMFMLMFVYVLCSCLCFMFYVYLSIVTLPLLAELPTSCTHQPQPNIKEINKKLTKKWGGGKEEERGRERKREEERGRERKREEERGRERKKEEEREDIPLGRRVDSWGCRQVECPLPSEPCRSRASALSL